ncbi:MAG: sensor histidine kinase [Luteolibacter sp.]
MKTLLALLALILATHAEELPLRTLAAVRTLPHEDAAKGIPVEIEGTVIFADPKDPGIIVHDGTDSCWFGAKTPFPQDLKSGSKVRATGRTESGSYFPNIAEAKAVVLGHGPLPEPRHVTGRDLFSPMLDSQWIEIEAVVIGTEEGGLAFTLVVDIDGNTFKADVPMQAGAAERVAAVMQRRVKLRGIVGTVFNQSFQMTGRHFFIPSFDHIILTETKLQEVPPPAKKIATLLRNDNAPNEITRVTGMVMQQTAGGFYLRDETASAFVHAGGNAVHPLGSQVEVEGFAAVAPFRPMLRASKVRMIGKGELPAPIRLDPNLGIRPNLQNERVEIDCEFLAKLEGPQETVLQCRSGDHYFETWLPYSISSKVELKPKDVVKLTGIYEVTTTHPMPRTEWADGFRIHLAGPHAIVLLRTAPWLTLNRVLMALGMSVAVILAFFVWTALLRRRVAAQREIITQQIERGVVKDERQRIARELHDTLEQDLTGLSMQLENATEEVGEENGRAYRSLTLVHRMLQHCRLEARASVSDLRNPDLLARDLPEAMQAALSDQVGDITALDFAVEGTPRPLRSTTQNQLLRIARESLNNALRHGKPSGIRCLLSYTSEGVTLEMEDNGSGFDSSKAPPAGHFGLTGMRERANKIQAQFSLISNPGIGTKIRVHLPYSSPEALPRERKF